ncbi:hypothetical protein [Mycolicibacterium iranicum]|uniref:Uncharacterized protein n=1 Tax=Mycolicibacterium iranicum TaxID=912594 RepID=A0A178LNY6_MYCIR|nr:hypothetical protein [Mycolicibacterium iranicum]OAN33790.1 hypothetical protein A4X20_27550 [Mycolicibacterium iranicum]
MSASLGMDTVVTVPASGLIFLWSLVLGIAHRAALLYAFATMLLSVFVELSAWPTWVNLTAEAVVVAFFVLTIATYVAHGIRRDTTNQGLDCYSAAVSILICIGLGRGIS